MDIKSYALGSLISIYFFEFQKCLSIFAKHSPSHRNYHTRKRAIRHQWVQCDTLRVLACIDDWVW